MKKSFLVIVMLAIAIGAGVAIGYPLYKSHVEEQIGFWLTTDIAAPGNGSVTFGQINADPISGAVEISDLRVELVDKTYKIGGEDLLLEQGIYTVDHATIHLETQFFLTPVTGIVKADLTGLRYKERYSSSIPEISSGTADTTIAQIVVEEFHAPPDLFPLQVDTLTDCANIIDKIAGKSITMSDITVSDPSLPSPVTIAELSYSGLRQGRFKEIRAKDLKSDLPSGGTLHYGAASIADLNLSETLRFVDSFDPVINPRPTIVDIGQAMGISSFGLSDISVDMKDRGRTEIGSLHLGSFDHDGIIPTAFEMELKGIVQQIPRLDMELLAASFSLPIAFEIPDSIISEGSLSYRLDSAKDQMHLHYTGSDSYTGVSAVLDLDMLGLSPVILSAMRGIPVSEQRMTEVKLHDLRLTLDGGAAWAEPAMIGNRPSPRLFALEKLGTTRLPPEIDSAIAKPVRAFLSKGGVLKLAVTPSAPFGAAVLGQMARLPPADFLRATGLSVSHTPAQ